MNSLVTCLGRGADRSPECSPHVVYRTYTAKNIPADIRGFAERVVRRRLERQGFTVWRGAMIGAHKRDDLYPTVAKKYQLLHRLLATEFPQCYDELMLLNDVHHGLPDFLGRKSLARTPLWLFVEAKWCHEQLLPSQRACIEALRRMGFLVEIHAITARASPRVRAHKDPLTGKCVMLEKQLRLTKRLCERDKLSNRRSRT